MQQLDMASSRMHFEHLTHHAIFEPKLQGKVQTFVDAMKKVMYFSNKHVETINLQKFNIAMTKGNYASF